ncbi:NACHT domain-containing protein [Dactylosporangium salmoneum]
MLGLALVIVGIPTAAVAASWRTFVSEHPKLAAALVLAWLLAIAVVALVRRVAAKPIDQRLDQLGNAMNLAVGRRVSRYGRRWRAYVLTSLRLVEAKGLATVGPHTPELDDIFVDLGLVARAPHQVPGGVLADAAGDGSHRRSIHDLIDHVEPARLAVLGAPGSGKTTLMRHVACQAARISRRRRRQMPILLTLRDYSAQLAADPPASLPQLIRQSLPGFDVAEPPGWWERQLQDGRCLVLLDGLDEVAEDAARRNVSYWIERQIAMFPGNDYVVTSRPQGYALAPVMVADVLQVQPFTDEQVRQFLHGWYAVDAQRSVGRDGRDVQARAREGADDLLSRLARAPQLFELTVNPLLLTMIANVHRYRGALPGGRADLYGEICQVMLWRRQEAKRLDTGLPGTSKERVLAELAFTMMRQRVRDLALGAILRTVAPILARFSQDVTSETFLADIASNGLLVERERGVYAFAHHTFGEYLAAKHIRDAGQVQVLVEAVDEVWWRESTLLYVAGSDADPIVRACLDKGTVTALALAFDCLDSGAEIATDLRERLRQVMAEAFNDNVDSDRRRLVAGVLGTRHLQHLVSTTAGTRVCPEPINSDLYWLFMRDTGTPSPDNPTRLTPQPARAVTGARGRDAAAFADWLNTVAAGATNGAYRLPTRLEVEDLAARLRRESPHHDTLKSGVWISGGETYAMPSLWIPDGEPEPFNVTGSDLAAAVTADFTMQPDLLNEASLVTCIAALSTILVYIHYPKLDLELSQVALDFARRRAGDSLRELHREIDLGRGRDRDLARTFDLVVDLIGSLSSIADRTLCGDSDSDLPFGRDFVRFIGHEFGRARDVAFARSRARDARDGAFANNRPGARDLDLDLVRARDRDAARDGARARVRSLARDLARDLALVRARAARTSGSAIDARDLASDVSHGGVALAVALARAREIDLVLGLVRGRNFTRTRGAYGYNPGFAVNLGRVLDHDLALELLLGPDRDYDRDLTVSIGVILAHFGVSPQDRITARPVDESGVRALANTLVHSAGIAQTHVISVNFDFLATAVHRACAELAVVTKAQGLSIANVLAGRLADAAESIFGRSRALAVGDAMVIRLAALTLAAEANRHHLASTAHIFRAVAAGITLFERRATGQAPMDKIIIARV